MKIKTGEAWVQSKEKRAFDVLFASVVGDLVMPIGLLALAAIAIENQHSPLFYQERIGKPGEELWIPKMRTLSGPIDNRSSATGHIHTRATGRLSRLARTTHIDETPQLRLVLSGEMSAVGPRPFVQEDYDSMMDTLSPPEQRELNGALTICKPGLVNSNSPLQHTPGYQFIPRQTAEATITYAYRDASRNEDQRIIMATTQAVLADLRRRMAGDAEVPVIDSISALPHNS